MKKFTCLYSVVFHNSLLGQRFVYDDLGGPESKDVPPPIGDTPEGPSFEDRLKDVRDAKDAIERATMLEEAMRTLDAEYAGKGTDRIRDGAGKVAQLADAMGLDKKAKAALLSDYKDNFQDYFTSNDSVKRELDTAQEADTKSALDDLQSAAHTKEEEKFNADFAQLEGEKGTLQGAITADEAIVTDYNDNKISAAQTQIDTALQTFEDLADNFGVGHWTDSDDQGTFDRVSQMNDADLKKACLAAEKEDDPRFEVHEGANLAATLQKDVDAVRQGQREVAKVIEAKQVLEAEKRVVQDRILTNQDAMTALNTKMTERSAAYEKTKASIEFGTYKEDGSDQTLKEAARTVAEGRVQPEELAIVEKYEKLAQAKTKELLRGAALKQLDAMEKDYDKRIANTDGKISARESILLTKKIKAQDALLSERNACGIYGAESGPEMRALVEAKVTKDNPRLAARDPEKLQHYVDNDLAELAKLQKKFEEASYAHRGGDATLQTLNRNKRELEAVVARIDAVKASPAFQA